MSQPTFTGNSNTVSITTADNTSGNYTPKGTVSQPTFTGSSLTSTGKFTPSGSVSVSSTGTANKTATVSSTSYSGQFIAAYDVNLPAEVTVRMQDPAASVWTMSFLDRPALEFTLNGVEEDLYDWNVTLHREEKSSGVIWAELKTGEGGMRIQERWRVAERGKENIYEGQFLVNIYNGDAPLDYCSMTFRPGFTTSYRTSR